MGLSATDLSLPEGIASTQRRTVWPRYAEKKTHRVLLASGRLDEGWVLRHPLGTIHEASILRSALRQPGNPGETVTCSRAHGFASPPYDGFALSRM